MYKKKYKKLFLIKEFFSFLFLSFLLIFSQIFSPALVEAATYTFQQSNWTGGATTNIANGINNGSNWNQFLTNNGLDVGQTLSLPITSNNVIETDQTDFNSGTNLQTSVFGSDDNSSLRLKDKVFTTSTISGGNDFALALKSDGTVWSWGKNNLGQLGNSINANVYYTPIQVLDSTGLEYLTGITSISAGYQSAYALKSDGTVWAWGNNGDGQLGNNTLTTSKLPVQVLDSTGAGYLTDVIKIGSYSYSAYALKSDGTVYSWGKNDYGQLGNNTLNTSKLPVQVLDSTGLEYLTGITSISSGYQSAYALKSDGTVWAWGNNGDGQLGNNTLTTSKLPVQVLDSTGAGYLSDVITISAGNQSSYALKSDGTVWAWGKNDYYGRLGNNSTVTSKIPVQVVGVGGTGYLSDIIFISSGALSAYALKSDGSIYSWGNNGNGQLGVNTNTYSKVPVQTLYRELIDFNIGSINNTDLAGGVSTSYILKSDGTVWAFGGNHSGRIGDNSLAHKYTPVQVHGPNNVGYLTDIIEIVADGSSSAMALKSDGTVWAWGKNSNGQLGNNTKVDSSTPVQVVGLGGSGYLTGIISIATGQDTAYALKSDGTVWSWGSNSYGQLGNNTKTESITPVQVVGLGGSGYLADVMSVASNYQSAYALKSDGTVWAWGKNNHGQLGNNTKVDSSTPVQVLGFGGFGYLTNATQISSSGVVGDVSAAYALKSDGSVWAWGSNYFGLLGNNDGTGSDKLTPIQVLDSNGVDYLTNIIKLSAGSSVLALKSDGTVWSWGKNDFGQIGDNSTTDRLIPVQVLGENGVGYLNDVVDFNSVYKSNIVLRSDGSVLTWGQNNLGQLGNNTTVDRHYPVAVKTFSNELNYFSLGSLGTTEYYSSGTHTSSILDLNNRVNFGVLSYDAVANGQNISVSLRAGNTNTPDDTWTSWNTFANNGSLSVLNSNRYIQYKVDMSTDVSTITPVFNSITFDYSYYATSGDLTSSIYDTNDNTSALKSVYISAIGTSEENTVKLQIRSSSDGNTWSAWCGYADCSGNTYFTLSENNLSLSSNHPLVSNDNDRYLQYKVFLSSGYTSTPSVSSVSLQYFFNISPTVTNVSAYQINDTENEYFGKVFISYDAKDIDGAFGTAHPGKVLPSFEYSVDNGNNWTPIGDQYLRGSDVTLKDVEGDTLTSYDAVWDAQKQIPYFDSNAIVRVKVDDGEIKNNSSTSTSTSFYIDNKFPEESNTISFDAGVAGSENSAIISIPLPEDSSSTIEYFIYDDEQTESNVKNSGWVVVTADTVIPWTFDGDIETKYLKYKFRDSFHNESPEKIINTHIPVPSSSFMVQDTSNVSASPAYYDLYIGWQATSSSDFYSYKLEQATSTDNLNYSEYQDVSSSSLLDVTTNYYIARNLNPDLYYKYRLAVIDTYGNTSVRSNSSITTRPDGVQNFGEGGGGSVSTASKIENVISSVDENKDVTISFKITDTSTYKKVNPLYEGYLFYNNGIILSANPLSGSALKVSDASKLKTSGYIQVNNEVIKYTGKSGNTLTGLVRGTWPNKISSGRTTRTNSSFFEGTPVWILAENTDPVVINNESLFSGQDNNLSWITYGETGLAGYNYTNLPIRILVHDNQDALSGPVSTQNDYSEDGVITSLDLSSPTVSFDTSSSSVEENSGTTTVTLSLSRAYPFDSTVNYTLGGTATGEFDYTLTNGSLTFKAGEKTSSILIPVIDDSLKEDDETITLTLSNPSNAYIGGNGLYTLTILDNDSYSLAGFSLTNVSNTENVTSIKIPITLSATSGVNVVVSYSVSGTASAEADYSLTGNSVTILQGETEASIDLTIVDDTRKEDNETVIVTLTDITGANLSTNTTYTYTIVDNDTYPTLSFGSLTSQGKEDLNTANILVNLSVAYPEDVTFKYYVTGGSAEGNGVDYLIEGNTGTIQAGSTSTNIPIVIFDDDLSEETENILITLSDPTNAVLGSDMIHAFSILDNEIMVTDINGASVKSTSARIVWTTADYTDSLIEYGTIQEGQEGSYSMSKQSVDKVLNHNVYIDGLTPETTYYFRTTSVNLAGEKTVSRSQFTTTPGPILSAVSSGDETDTSARISWTTNIPATSTVTYSINPNMTSPLTTNLSDLTLEHSVVLSNLLPNEIYYYFVTSADESGNLGEEANGGSYYTLNTNDDETAPVISDIATPIRTSSQVAVTWTTSEPADGRVRYGTNSGDYTASTELIYTLVSNHLATINDLEESTQYYYIIESSDENGNQTTSAEYSFETTAKEKVIITKGGGGVTGVAQELYDLLLAENQAYKAKYSSLDSLAPEISNIEISNITAFTATVSFDTSADTIAFVKYGKDNSYEQVSADDNWSQRHSIKLSGLSLGTEYNFKINAMDKANNTGTSDNQKFTTKYLTENLSELQKIDNVEQFQKEIESTIESILPSLVPPFIDKPEVTDITENSATINYRTNVKSFPIVSYAEEGKYNSSNENPYDGETSDTVEKTLDHSVKLIGLKSNTKYHFSAKAYSLPGVVGKSDDFVFNTSASKIQASIVEIKKDSFNVVWSTDEVTSSIVEYKNLKNGRVSKIVDDARNTSHSIKIENLTPGTEYEVSVSGLNSKGNILESTSVINVRTSTDNNPPVVTNLKVDSALVQGRTDRVQTIVSWQTDEPSTSTVYYEEGSGTSKADLNSKIEDKELTRNHVMILGSLKPGTVYRFTVSSTDDVGNNSKLPIRTIITPKKTESIVDVIFKNFDDTFNFINNVK